MELIDQDFPPLHPESEFQGQHLPGPNLLLPQLRDVCPSVLRYLRHLLKVQPILRADWDTLDFFQELSTRYMVRLGLRNSADLADGHSRALVKKMARHLSIDQLRHLRAKRRDVMKRDCKGTVPDDSRISREIPLNAMVAKETLDNIRKNISKNDWELLRLKGEGFGWVEISRKLGKKPNTLRMRFNRLAAKLSDIP